MVNAARAKDGSAATKGLLVPRAQRKTQHATSATHQALRLGCTSAVYPEDVLPNVQRLAGRVRDIEWVVFEVAYGLPGPEVIEEMARLGREHGHSYTVHLPLDLRLAAADEAARAESVATACRVIAQARALDPWAFIVHVEDERGEEAAWRERALASLVALGAAAGGAERLAVENLPGYPAERLEPLLDALPVSVCLDVGHLLAQGRDPRALLARWLGRTRVLHLHARENGRDHRSLAHMERGLLRDLLQALQRATYDGVVTIELFDTEALWESWAVVGKAWQMWAESL
ncbi:MAG: cobamide remodeling phosphodiesterase CbiR [Anaerolineae bacterium]